MTPPASAVAPSVGRAAPLPRRAPAPRRSTSPVRAPARRPRRISGPVRPARAASPARAARPLRSAAHSAPRPAGALLDRLIRGRLWIGLLAFSLIGIVAMQLVVLKLNTGVGRTLTRVATLQRANAQLGIEDSMYSAETRVAPLAAAAGMTLAAPGTVHFVQAAQADISKAAAVLSQPIQPSVEAATAQAASAEAPAPSSQAGEVASSSATSETSSAPGEVSESSSTSTGG